MAENKPKSDSAPLKKADIKKDAKQRIRIRLKATPGHGKLKNPVKKSCYHVILSNFFLFDFLT